MDLNSYKRQLVIGDEAMSRRTAQRYKISQDDSEDEVVQHDEARINHFAEEMEGIMNNRCEILLHEENTNANVDNTEHYDYLEELINIMEADAGCRYKESDYPKNLKAFMESKAFSEPITSAVDKTMGEVFMMALTYSRNNGLSVTAMTNLFKMFNTIFATPILPDSKYICDKLLNSNEGLQYYAVCPQCSSYLGKFGETESLTNCSFCHVKLDLKNTNSTSFFVLINPATQISDLLHIYEDYYDFVTRERIQKTNSIEDVYDGKAYHEFLNSLIEQDKQNYVTTMFNTDGAPKFKCSKYSIWPIYLKLNELPKQERSDKLITCGLWFNKKKPEMSAFLDPFVDLVNDLSISCTIKNEQRYIKLYILTCCVDSVARAQIQGVKQYNGQFGCNWCLHPGEFHGSMKYVLLKEPARARNHKETVKLMLEVDPENPVYGIKYPSPFINLSKFDIIQGFIPDYLHFYLEGVASQFTDYYLNPLSNDQVKLLDEKMMQIAVPQQIARLTRPLSCRNDWKAREWENFVLFASIPVLSDVLDKKRFNHWLLLVESLFIFLQNEIHIDELNEANQKLYKFVSQVKELFFVEAMTFNVHQLLHIYESVLNWGPLWTNSTFCFESANHYLLKAIKCAKGVTHQIVRFVNINHSLQLIKEHVNNRADDAVKYYCENILSAKVWSCSRISKTLYFGRSESVDESTLNMLQLPEHSTSSYSKMVKHRCLFECKSINKIRSNNSFARLNNGMFVRLVNFIVNEETEQELTICNVVHTRNAFSDAYPMLQMVTKIEKNIKVVFL